MAKPLSNDLLEEVVKTYYMYGQNFAQAAKALKLTRSTLRTRYERALVTLPKKTLTKLAKTKVVDNLEELTAPSHKIPDEELLLDVQAYYDHGGNKSEAALERGLNRKTYADRLTMASERLGVQFGKVAEGVIEAQEPLTLGLPPKGHIKRYIISSIQNNTHLHPGFNNILALRDYYNNLPSSSCELLIGTFSYQMAAYGAKAVKRGTYQGSKVTEDVWYAPEAVEYIKDESLELAPGLVWCGEQNILPTNLHPLTGFEAYNGRKSNILPHAKISMQSVAAMKDESAKLNYSTGTVTQRNYIQKRAGIMAEKDHNYGALLVEVDYDGNWWVRQLHIDEDHAVMDIGPSGVSGIRAQAGLVKEQEVVEVITWADLHASEMELWVRNLCFGEGGMLDTLRPKYQFLHDVFSMRSRGHHEEYDFHRIYEKRVTKEASVEEEVKVTAEILKETARDYCHTVVISSNHDRHLNRWLNEADFRRDPLNAKYFCKLQYQVLDALDRSDKDFNILEWAMHDTEICPKDIEFLKLDKSYVIKGIENGLHGDLGPNGSRGSTANLTKLGRPVNKGHDHQAAIRGNVYSVGTCSLSFSYLKGPSSHSVSHIVTLENGTRQIVTMWGNRFRA